MSAVLSQQSSRGTFTGGIWSADDPVNDLQVYGYVKRPAWPLLGDKQELQVVCAFIISTHDIGNAAKSFVDIAGAISQGFEYSCNTTVIVEPQDGKVYCTLEVTKDRRGVDLVEQVVDRIYSPRGPHFRAELGKLLAVHLANELSARGFVNVNTLPAVA